MFVPRENFQFPKVRVPPNSIMLLDAQISGHNIKVPVETRSSEQLSVEKGVVIGKIWDNYDQESSDVVDYERITPEMIQLDESAPEGVKERLTELLNKYRECFAFNLKELGCTNLVEMSIKNNNVPVN